ncbi:hypothetical protein LTR95_008276 [Oleoguttula sp. CCFEE 5521]
MDGESKEHRAARIKALWDQLDTKKKGNVDLPALKNGLARMNHPLKDADGLVREMLSAADINHDGSISYEGASQFCKFCAQTEQELWTLFQSIDRDHNGQLDKSELSTAFQRAGVAVSNARLDRFFSYIDKDRNGSIDYNEWRASCKYADPLESDFLLFIPTHAPGLHAVLSYYTTAAKLSIEGDVHISDEALQGLGMALQFLKTSLFGAIIQLVQPQVTPNPVAMSDPPQPLDAAYIGIDTDDDDMRVRDDPHIPLKPARRKLTLTDLVPDVGYFVAGGVSGITSRTATAPLDRLKVYLIAQTGNTQAAADAVKKVAPVAATQHGARTLINACKELWAAGGIRSLFAGNGINVVKVMPESAVKFGSYEAAKRAVAKFEGHDDPRKISSTSQFIAGGVAGMISQAVVYPLDTLKFRMQCETVAGGEHGNKLIWHTAQKMWQRNGIVAFYRGLPMGLAGMFPYAAIDLFLFETFKKRIVARNMKLKGIKHEEDALPGNFTLALMGGCSGALGASVVYPVNLLRTRLQSQGTALHPPTYTGIMDVTRRTIANEGWRGLFKGLTPNLLKVVPAVSITYVMYENTKKAMKLH